MCFHFAKKQFLYGFMLGAYFLSLFPSIDLMLFVSDLPSTEADRYFYTPSLFMFGYISLWLARILTPGWWQVSGMLVISTILFAVSSKQIVVWQNNTVLLENNFRYYPTREFGARLAWEYSLAGDKDKCCHILHLAKQLPDTVFINNVYYTWLEYSSLAASCGDSSEAAYFMQKSLQGDIECAEDIDIPKIITPTAYPKSEAEYKKLRSELIFKNKCTLKPARF